MAVTNGWGQAAKNNTNGYGKLATNNIGAGSIYEDSYSGDTALIGTSAAFSYSASSFTQADSNPTPTITGNTGGTFSGTSGLVFVSTSTGEINLSASTIAAHVVTYTVDGVSADFSLSVNAAPFANQFSFEFDGVDENFQTSSKLINTDFTLSFWINANGSYPIHQARFPVSITPSNTTAPNETIGRIIKNGTTLQASIQCFDSTGSGFSTYILDAPTLEGAGWNHLLFTYNKTTKHIFCYLNGTRRDWQKNPTNPTKHQFLTAISSRLYESDLTIGRNKPNVPTGTFNGLVDEVSTFNSILSQTDINTIYGSGTPSNISSLNPVAWYRMGEEGTFNSGTGVWTLTDQGSGGNNATSNNMEETDRKADTP